LRNFLWLEGKWSGVGVGAIVREKLYLVGLGKGVVIGDKNIFLMDEIMVAVI
jgi:hypothetical protein